jgi:hypothetical protein
VATTVRILWTSPLVCRSNKRSLILLTVAPDRAPAAENHSICGSTISVGWAYIPSWSGNLINWCVPVWTTGGVCLGPKSPPIHRPDVRRDRCTVAVAAEASTGWLASRRAEAEADATKLINRWNSFDLLRPLLLTALHYLIWINKIWNATLRIAVG